MESLKKEAIEAITKLPETATMEDIMERLYVMDKVRNGQAAIKKSDSSPTSE